MPVVAYIVAMGISNSGVVAAGSKLSRLWIFKLMCTIYTSIPCHPEALLKLSNFECSENKHELRSLIQKTHIRLKKTFLYSCHFGSWRSIWNTNQNEKKRKFNEESSTVERKRCVLRDHLKGPGEYTWRNEEARLSSCSAHLPGRSLTLKVPVTFMDYVCWAVDVYSSSERWASRGSFSTESVGWLFQ